MELLFRINVSYPEGYASEAYMDIESFDEEIRDLVERKIAQVNEANKGRVYHEQIQFKLEE